MESEITDKSRYLITLGRLALWFGSLQQPNTTRDKTGGATSIFTSILDLWADTHTRSLWVSSSSPPSFNHWAKLTKPLPICIVQWTSSIITVQVYHPLLIKPLTGCYTEIRWGKCSQPPNYILSYHIRDEWSRNLFRVEKRWVKVSSVTVNTTDFCRIKLMTNQKVFCSTKQVTNRYQKT